MDKSRRLSRRPSNTTPSAPRWRRPSFRSRVDADDAAPALAPAPDSREQIKKLLRDRDDDGAASDKDSECSRPMKALEEQAQRQQLLSASAVDLPVASTSLVPDFLPVQPIQDIPALGPGPSFKSKYNLHNPVGPPWYKNHHLIPRKPPSSTFSPTFPPMRTAIGAGTFADVGRMPGPSRTPSESPLATPNASQTRLGEGFAAAPGARSRKVSQTAHDNVDMLDGTDPWGTNWHHQSPYDVGGLNTPPVQEVRLYFRSSLILFPD
ncbi:hypothetical protein DFH11DRAFT_16260 [Phellopilus nigrolimitatus]|nr:hypothetical protein DFH11DRAFT_16260 [Phellopilus nigrolimitatus]